MGQCGEHPFPKYLKFLGLDWTPSASDFYFCFLCLVYHFSISWKVLLALSGLSVCPSLCMRMLWNTIMGRIFRME